MRSVLNSKFHKHSFACPGGRCSHAACPLVLVSRRAVPSYRSQPCFAQAQQATEPSPHSKDAPQELMQALARHRGVRVQINSAQEDEEDDDDDPLDELDDPWMARPAQPDTDRPDFLQASSLPSSSPSPLATAAVEHPNREAAAAIRRVDPAGMHALASEQPFLLVLDVRSDAEWAAGKSRRYSNSIHIPLDQLTAAGSAKLRSSPQQPVIVLDTGDHRGQQACIRLTRVFGFDHNLIYLQDRSH